MRATSGSAPGVISKQNHDGTSRRKRDIATRRSPTHYFPDFYEGIAECTPQYLCTVSLSEATDGQGAVVNREAKRPRKHVKYH